MKTNKLITLLAMSAMIGVTGCKDLTTTYDPNRPTESSPKLLFVGIQSAIWSSYGSDLSRLSALFTQQGVPGANTQYVPYYNYQITESVTNGIHYGFYITGGLVDIRKLREQAEESNDTLFVGISKIQEAMLMSLATSVFGDLVYSEALQGGQPGLDEQMDIFADLIALLDDGITDLESAPLVGGPEDGDLVYWTGTTQAQRQAQKDKWIAMAYTLKARIHLNMAEVDPANYELARLAALEGIMSPDNDYQTVYSGAGGEENQLALFNRFRPGQLRPNTFFTGLLEQRNDPRLEEYFTYSATDDDYSYSSTFAGPTSPQKIVTADENVLILAETEYRRGNTGGAVTYLNMYQGFHGITPTTPAGTDILREILTEKYIALFHQVEAWNDYKRTCYPNLVPVSSSRDITARLFYDTHERSANPNYPSANNQPARNDNDPANATDPFGAPCLGQ